MGTNTTTTDLSEEEAGRVTETRLSSNTPVLFNVFDACLKLLLASLLVSIVLAQVLAGVLFILWLILMRTGMPYKPTKLDVPILMYVLVRVLSIVFSEFPEMSVNAVSRELVYYVSYFFTAFYFQHAGRERVRQTLEWLVVSTVIVTVIVSIQYLLGYTIRARPLSGGGTLATHLSFVVIVALVKGVDRQVFPSRLLWFGTLLLLFVGLILSLTRGDLIAVVLVVTIYAFAFNRKLLLVPAVVVLALVLLLPEIRERLFTLVQPLTHSSDRTALWEGAYHHATEHPLLGFGPETFHAVYDNWERTADKSIGAWHNDFIQLYIESGLLGVIGWSVVLSVLLAMSVRLIKHCSGGERDVGWIGLLLLIAYVVIGLFGTPTVSITNAILFRFLAAMVAVAYWGRM